MIAGMDKVDANAKPLGAGVERWLLEVLHSKPLVPNDDLVAMASTKRTENLASIPPNHQAAEPAPVWPMHRPSRQPRRPSSLATGVRNSPMSSPWQSPASIRRDGGGAVGSSAASSTAAGTVGSSIINHPTRRGRHRRTHSGPAALVRAPARPQQSLLGRRRSDNELAATAAGSPNLTPRKSRRSSEL